MKPDRLKFARLIGIISNCAGRVLMVDEVAEFDRIIDIEVPAMNVEQLNTLLSIMQRGTNKIDAIKQYRMMTGCCLVDSKNAVEAYWRPAETAKTYTKQDLLSKSAIAPLTSEEGSFIDRFINKYLTD